MDAIFMNYKNSKASDPNRLISIYYAWKNIKKSYKRNKQKYQLQHGMKNLNNLMDDILYQVFKITLNISYKNLKKILIIFQ